MTEHYQYLVGLKEQGNVLLAGRTQEDESIGLIVFEAVNDEDAQAIVDADPSVQAGVMNATLHPYRVAIMQGRD